MLTMSCPDAEVYGGFREALDLSMLGNQPALYRVIVSYEGSFQGNATAYANMPDGTSYAVCTTMQYGYKPVMNSTMLRVAPQSTEATQPTKTPEQTQAEAEQSRNPQRSSSLTNTRGNYYF